MSARWKCAAAVCLSISTVFSAPCAPRDGAAGLPTINAHEHFESLEAYETYLRALGDSPTEADFLIGTHNTFFAFPEAPPGGASDKPNNEVIAEIHVRYPDRTVPFFVVEHGDPDPLRSVSKFLTVAPEGGVHIRGSAFEKDRMVNALRLWPLYAHCEAEGIPIVMHYTVGGLEGVRNVLDEFPRLRVLVPHLLYSLHDLELADSLLAAYPNLYTDLAFGYLHWMDSSLKRVSANSAAVRVLVMRRPDQFLWGTDHVIRPRLTDAERIASAVRAYKDLLSEQRYRSDLLGDDELNGLALPRDVLRRVFRGNAERFLRAGPAAFPRPGPAPLPRAGLEVILTGSSLPGEGMNREGTRDDNRMAVAAGLRETLVAADVLHVVSETSVVETAPREKWRFYSTPDDFRALLDLGVDIVELTGNHMFDYGPASFRKTLGFYERNNIAHYGGGANAADAARVSTLIRDGIAVHFYGASHHSGPVDPKKPDRNKYTRRSMTSSLQAFADEPGCLIYAFHGGDEFNPQPYYSYRRAAYAAIDAGADIVVGTHAHAVLADETHAGVQIHYGLGNFLFRDTDREVRKMLRLTCTSQGVQRVKPVTLSERNGVLDVTDERHVPPYRKVALSSPWEARLDLQLLSFTVDDPQYTAWLPRSAPDLGVILPTEPWSGPVDCDPGKAARPGHVRFHEALDDPGCAARVRRTPSLRIVLDLSDDAALRRITDLIASDPATVRRFLEAHAGSVDLAMSFPQPPNGMKRGALTNYLFRRVNALRNALAASEYYFPVLADPGTEWGYPYHLEQHRAGLALPAPVVTKIYSTD